MIEIGTLLIPRRFPSLPFPSLPFPSLPFPSFSHPRYTVEDIKLMELNLLHVVNWDLNPASPHAFVRHLLNPRILSLVGGGAVAATSAAAGRTGLEIERSKEGSRRSNSSSDSSVADKTQAELELEEEIGDVGDRLGMGTVVGVPAQARESLGADIDSLCDSDPELAGSEVSDEEEEGREEEFGTEMSSSCKEKNMMEDWKDNQVAWLRMLAEQRSLLQRHAEAFIDFALCDYAFLRFTPSDVAVAAVMCAFKNAPASQKQSQGEAGEGMQPTSMSSSARISTPWLASIAALGVDLSRADACEALLMSEFYRSFPQYAAEAVADQDQGVGSAEGGVQAEEEESEDDGRCESPQSIMVSNEALSAMASTGSGAAAGAPTAVVGATEAATATVAMKNTKATTTTAYDADAVGAGVARDAASSPPQLASSSDAAMRKRLHNGERKPLPSAKVQATSTKGCEIVLVAKDGQAVRPIAMRPARA